MSSMHDVVWHWQTVVAILGLLGVYFYRSRITSSHALPLPPGPSEPPTGH
jgi:hypothetical protein